MAMVCGAETTPEDEFLYSPDMHDFITSWDKSWDTRYRSMKNVSHRTFLEYFAWALYQKIDKGEL